MTGVVMATPQSVLTPENTDLAVGLFTKVINGLASLYYTAADFFITLFTNPAELGTVVVIMLIGDAFGWVLHKIKSKI